MGFTITTEMLFSAAHYLRGYEGACAKLHGHNWTVEVSVSAATLDKNGFVIDFMVLENFLKQTLAPFDHNNLNDVPPFDTQNPTAENIAAHVHNAMTEKIQKHAPKVFIREVTVWEVGKYRATYRCGKGEK